MERARKIGIIRAALSASTITEPNIPEAESAISEPTIIPRSGHNISRSNVSPGALTVLNTLRDAGHEAYLVGGGVRDWSLGLRSLYPGDADGPAHGASGLAGLVTDCRRRIAHLSCHRGGQVVAVESRATSQGFD